MWTSAVCCSSFLLEKVPWSAVRATATDREYVTMFFAILSLLTLYSFGHHAAAKESAAASGLRVSQFRGHPGIFQLTCSAEALGADANLLSMVLFRLTDSAILASLNMANRECSTSAGFSACVIAEKDSRRSSVETLIMSLREGETRRFGCEVSSMRSGERITVASWSVAVTGRKAGHRDTTTPLHQQLRSQRWRQLKM